MADTRNVIKEPKPNIIRPIGNSVINDNRAPLPEKLDSLPNKLIHPNIEPIINVRTQIQSDRDYNGVSTKSGSLKKQ